MRYVSEMRSTLSLMRRSRNVRTSDVLMATTEITSYLARQNLIYPPTFHRLGLSPGQSYVERKQRLGLADFGDLTPEELDFQAFFEQQQRASRKAQWIWRIGQQALEMQKEGWYGFFVTLTVDPARVPDSQSMWEENREFRCYIRRLARVAAAASGHPGAIRAGVSCSQFVKHVGVVEHGSSRHHHHMHLLLWMRDIPASWKVDPNAGVRDPRHRTSDWCRPMSTFWPHSLPGLGRAKYFRHEGDIWSALGFVLPWDKKKERIIRVHPPVKAGIYVSKYMDKEDKAWLHRVKNTRGLGLGLLRKTLIEISIKKLTALTWRPRSFDLQASIPGIHSVPSGLLRSMAKQELFCRQWENNTLDYPAMLSPVNCVPFSAMLKSVRDGARPRRLSSKALFEWVTEHLPVPDGYSEQAIYVASHELGINFPPDRSVPTSHIGILNGRT